MGPEVFIIPLIALAVWILQYIFQGNEEKKPQGKTRQPGTGRPANRPRRSATDLDRYLEETRKRKQQEENRPVVIAEVVPEPAERPRAVVPPKAPPPAPRPAPRPPLRPTPQPQRGSQPQPEPPRRGIAQVEPTRPVVEVVTVQAPAERTRDVQPSLRPEPQAAKAGDVPGGRQKTAPPQLVELMRLLRSPQGLATAVVLREIFEEPAWRRGPHTR